MSFSGARRVPSIHSSSLAVLLIISLWVISIPSRAAAIRIFSQRSLAAEEEGKPPPMEAARPGKSQTEIFREYFKSRLADLNSTTDDRFHDYKRRIPSCPDPLHN